MFGAGIRAAGLLALISTLQTAQSSEQCSGASCSDSDDDAFGAVQLMSRRTEPTQKCVYKKNVRVRREWRTLSEEVLAKVKHAFWVLKNTTQAEGEKKYGPYFVYYDEFLMQHACAVYDPRCDQGHEGPQFMTYHRLLLLRMEKALLSVDPSIEAMPWWDLAADSVGGKYYKDGDNYIFSDKYFGSYWGQGPGNEVIDGMFANWPIPIFSEETFGSKSPMATKAYCVRHGYFTGMKASTCTQCCDGGFHKEGCTCPDEDLPIYMRSQTDCTATLARQPDDKRGPQGYFMLGGSMDLVYNNESFQACQQYPENVRTWMEWQNCQTMIFFFCQGEVRAKEMASNKHIVDYLKAEVFPAIKSQLDKEGNETDAAQTIAGLYNRFMTAVDSTAADAMSKVINETCELPMLYGYYSKAKGGGHEYPTMHHGHAHEKEGRDFMYLASSINDPGSFSGHHTNLDRSNMGFQVNSFQADPSIVDNFWDYPNSQSIVGSEKITDLKNGMSGPFGTAAIAMCGSNPERYPYYQVGAQPWTSGTLLDDIVSASFPFIDLLNDTCSDGEDCSGRPNGYTHKDVLRLTVPTSTPYTYDTLEHLIC